MQKPFVLYAYLDPGDGWRIEQVEQVEQPHFSEGWPTSAYGAPTAGADGGVPPALG